MKKNRRYIFNLYKTISDKNNSKFLLKISKIKIYIFFCKYKKILIFDVIIT